MSPACGSGGSARDREKEKEKHGMEEPPRDP